MNNEPEQIEDTAMDLLAFAKVTKRLQLTGATHDADNSLAPENLNAWLDSTTAEDVEEEWLDLRLAVQRAICRLNRAKEGGRWVTWSEVEQALAECGTYFGCDPEARWSCEVDRKKPTGDNRVQWHRPTGNTVHRSRPKQQVARVDEWWWCDIGRATICACHGTALCDGCQTAADLIADVEARGGRLTVKVGPYGPYLGVAPKYIAQPLADELSRHKQAISVLLREREAKLGSAGCGA